MSWWNATAASNYNPDIKGIQVSEVDLISVVYGSKFKAIQTTSLHRKYTV